MPSTSACFDSADTRLASVSRLSLVRLSDATWNTCSPRTLATLESSGRPAISFSTPTLAAAYVALLTAEAPAPAMVPPVARITTLGSACCACASALAASNAAPAAKARKRGERCAWRTPVLRWNFSGRPGRYMKPCPHALPAHAGTACGRARGPRDGPDKGEVLPSTARPAAHRHHERRSRRPPRLDRPGNARPPTARCRARGPGANASWRRSAPRRSPSSACTA